MTTPEQGRSGYWFRLVRRHERGAKNWIVVGRLEGSKVDRLFAEEVYYDDAVTEIKRLLENPKPKPM